MTHLLLAAEGGYQAFDLGGTEWFWLIARPAPPCSPSSWASCSMRGVLAADQGTPKMLEIAAAIQEGAMAYLRRQFRTIGVHPDPAGRRGVLHRDGGG